MTDWSLKSMDATLMIENQIFLLKSPSSMLLQRFEPMHSMLMAGKDKYGDDNQLKWTLETRNYRSEGGWSDTGIIPNNKEATLQSLDSNKVKKQAGPGR